MLAHRTQPNIPNEEFCRHAQQRPLVVEAKLWKWKWIGHTLRKYSSSVDKYIGWALSKG
jgi:hypothetical protein